MVTIITLSSLTTLLKFKITLPSPFSSPLPLPLPPLPSPIITSNHLVYVLLWVVSHECKIKEGHTQVKYYSDKLTYFFRRKKKKSADR